MKFREVVRLPEFERDMRRLARRFSTLEEDLALFIETAVFAHHKLKRDTGIVAISNLGRVTLPVYKARKFACRALKGHGVRTGIRVIYAYHETQDRIELIEIYFKSDQENENRDRIRKHYGADAN